ncbi:MAG: MBL fold metallo-hydrolase [Actinomycetota bacterium]|nr:MBL fold metallo-hydrolase [Actinomycetota bacterium]
MKPLEITAGVFQVGGPDVTSPDDCCIYFIDLGRPILIDTGSGKNPKSLIRNLQSLDYRPRNIELVVLTHCHIDHIGGAPYLAERYSLPLAIHELDARAVEEGDERRTAASLYGSSFSPTTVKYHLQGEEGTLDAGASPLHWLHTPGHTPGSISLWIDTGLYRVLFGQDIHGPFYAAFGSDLDDWTRSMHRLLNLEADILCEGHFGIYRPASEVRMYIEDYLRNYNKL